MSKTSTNKEQAALDAEIMQRFFDTLDKQKAQGTGCMAQFCDLHGLNIGNVYKQKVDPTRRVIHVSWLAWLCRDYGISPEWLLTGRGEMYSVGGSIKERQQRQQVKQRIMEQLAEL